MTADRVLVGTEVGDPTHDVSLTDGKVTIGFKIVDGQGNKATGGVTRQPTDRSAIKTTSGDLSYSDLDLPWGNNVQEDWSGGRASKWFEKDKSKYFDSGGVNTQAGYITLAKQETYTKGLRSQEFSLPGSMRFLPLIPGDRAYLAIAVIPSATFTAANVWMWIKKLGTPGASLTLELCSDDANKPGTVLKTATVAVTAITDTLSVFHKFALPSTQSVSAATRYWIKVYSAGGTSTDHWLVGYKNAVGLTKQSAAGSTWADSSIDLYYRITDADVTKKRRFFNYKYMQYVVESPTGAAPKLFMIGDRGVADANTGALSTLVDASKSGSWLVDEFAGCVVWLINGTGASEDTPYRTIVSNTTTVLTLDTPWVIEHDTTTEYVILGANKWREITGHGMTGPVTDIAQASGFVYFAQGDAIAIRRYKWEQAAGAASETWAADGTNMAHKLAVVRDAIQGLLIWKANNNGATGPSIARADAVTSWANLTFGTAITLNVAVGKINSINEGGDPKELYIMCEGTVMKCVTDTSASGSADRLDEIPLNEIRTTMSPRNGVTSIMHNVYLYFNLGRGVEQFYSSDMVDMGPNKGEGLPAERRGYINHMVGYPGSVLMAVNGEAANYSSVLAHVVGNSSYHEEYRAPVVGYEIDSLAFQTIPGTTSDRLYISCGPDIVWLPFPSDDFNILNDSQMRYRHEGYVISGYTTANMIDATKIYNSFKAWSDYLSTDDGQTAKIQYQVDEETGWTDADDYFDESPIKEVTMGGNTPVTGKKMRYRLILQSTDNTKTPQIRSINNESVIRIIVKYAMTWNYKAEDGQVDIRGERTSITAKEMQEQIDYWAENFTPLFIRTNDPVTDRKIVWIDPVATIGKKRSQPSYVGTIVASELRKERYAQTV